MIFNPYKIMYFMKKTKNLLQWISSDLASIFWKMRKKMKKCAFLPKTRVKNFSLENQFWSLMNHGKFLMILTIFAPVHMLPQISTKNIKFHDFLNFKIHKLAKKTPNRDRHVWFSKQFSFLNKFDKKSLFLYWFLFIWKYQKIRSRKSKNRGE